MAGASVLGLHSWPSLHPHPGRQHLYPSITPTLPWSSLIPTTIISGMQRSLVGSEQISTGDKVGCYLTSQASSLNCIWASSSVKQTQYNHLINMLLQIKWDNTWKELGICYVAKCNMWLWMLLFSFLEGLSFVSSTNRCSPLKTLLNQLVYTLYLLSYYKQMTIN